ncbi:MAG: hypothetical protein ABL995_07370 [Bryobacteraceae bacterium]
MIRNLFGSTRRLLVFAALTIALPVGAFAQAGRGGQAAPRSARDAAPIDLTGYWVSVVTEDWRFRMVTPPKGDYASVPLNPAGRKVADAWDPTKEDDACKAYGAAALMRVPGRVHITWQDDATMKLDTDAGTQTRLLHFGGARPQGLKPSLQGYSRSQWEPAAGGRGGDLKAITTDLQAGSLRKNGVPYSDKTVVTEYMNRADESNGESWLIITTIVEDPEYLNQPFITSTHFKRQVDASGWNPSPCTR